MRVLDVARFEPRSIAADAHLARAANLMADVGCGFLPVLGPEGRVVGVLTDRDIALAVGARDKRPSEILVRDVMNAVLFTATPEQELVDALATMRDGKVRRLVVVDADFRLLGVLSLDDVVLEARPAEVGTEGMPHYADVALTLRAIVAHGELVAV